MLILSPSFYAATSPPKPAQLKVSGYGFLGNRQLKRVLSNLELSGKKPEFFGASFVEDAALIITSQVKRDGYLQPKITARLIAEDGREMNVQTDDLIENPLPRPLRLRSVHFMIHKGVLFHFQSLAFEGLESIDEKQASSFFIETGALLHPKKARVYTPEKLRHGLASLTETLDRQGYQEAKAEATEVNRDDRTGRVDVRIKVAQGPRFIVHSVREEFSYDGAVEASQTRTLNPNRAYSHVWLQDFTQSLKTNLFQRGYPDVSVEVKTLSRQGEDQRIELDLLAEVKSGPQVRVGQVKFEGEKRTKPRFLARRVRVKRGELLDRIRVEQGRYRLAQTGAFSSVDLNYQPVDEHTRDVIYQVKEGRSRTVSLLFGYGSYELLRGGFEVEENNIWGLGHHARLKAVQSFKSTSGEFTYTIPDPLGRDVDLFFNGSALRREEISFTREEYGGGFGGHKYFKSMATDFTMRYNYQILNAVGLFPAVASEGVTNPAVGSIITEIKYDRRDNPLYPRKGFKLFATFESAAEELGGDVNYQRIETAASWYRRLGGGRWLGLALSHGVAIPFGTPAQNLPFNKRFFPGGDNSIRGYQEGEASPRDPQGRILGAETYTLATVQLEQALTPKWSLVFFSDSLGIARRMRNYPFDTGLFSVGAGVWWKTIIGPVRLEHGHNLNPRKHDPAGTIQFSLGFPF